MTKKNFSLLRHCRLEPIHFHSKMEYLLSAYLPLELNKISQVQEISNRVAAHALMMFF